MSTDPNRALIQLDPEVRKQLQLLKIKFNAKSYDDVIQIVLKKAGLWDSSLENGKDNKK